MHEATKPAAMATRRFASADRIGWPRSESAGDVLPGQVRTLTVRPGFEVMLSTLVPTREWCVGHTEEADVFGMGFHLRGGTVFETRAGAVRTRAGDCWIGEAARGSASLVRVPASGMRTLSIRFSPAVAAAMLDGSALSQQAARAARHGPGELRMRRGLPLAPPMVDLVDGLFDISRHGALHRLQVESAALSLLASQLIDECEPVPAQALMPRDLRRMQQVREHLEAHLDDPPGLMALARIAGTNEFSLKRDFKRAYGTTVYGHVREQRMQQAAQRLRDGDSVADAAAYVGYCCPSRFAQAFRRRYGVVPSRWCATKAPPAHD